MFVGRDSLFRKTPRATSEMKKLYLVAFIVLSCSPTEIFSASKTKKKTYKTTTESTATTTSQPAIIAIEIVDPNENSTSAKHSKRTIEGSLGYGYNSFDASKPRYEVYKYSQHDIPPYNGVANPISPSSSAHNQVNVQKSVQYTLPAISHQAAAGSNILQPGTTLYSSLSDKGKVGGLSTSFPEASSSEYSNIPVPVVVLRIYPNQLKDSTIQANLPKSHPFAKTINSLNIQTLLLQYIKTLKNPGVLSQYSTNQAQFGHSFGSSNQYSTNKGSFGQGLGSQSQYSASQGSLGHHRGTSNYLAANQGLIGQHYKSSNQYSANQASSGENHGISNQYYANQGALGQKTYSANQVIPSSVSTPVKLPQTNYQTSNYYNQGNYQNIPTYQSNNVGSQNYMYYQQSYPQQPVQEYTRQNQYQQQQYPEYNSGVTVVEAPVKYEISPQQIGNQWKYQTSAIQKLHVQKPQETKSSTHTPQPEYYYVQPNIQNGYTAETTKYYQPTQLLDYNKPTVKTAAVPDQQYYTGNDESQYSGYYQNDGQQYEAKNQKLLTFENYPTNKHTGVVFKTKSGHVRTPEPEQSLPKEIKTIKIHVPDDVANVEVQETERPYYAPESTYSDAKHQNNEQSADTYQQNGDMEKVVSQDNYYSPPDIANQHYYNNEDSASEVIYKYQNLNYDDMVKYFEKRGAMPKHFFQSQEDTEDVTELNIEAAKDTQDLISAYEEAAFPATSSAPVTKKVKSKKRIPM